MFTAQLLCIAALCCEAFPSPLPNDKRYVAWNDGPSTRGTWSLLSSCVLTLVLCVYTAVHLNVAAPGTPTKAQNRKLAKWICIGIFAPEIIVYAAIIQWTEARSLTKEVKQIRNKWVGDVPEWLSTWGLAQSFFVNMGGLSLSQHYPESSTIPASDNVCVLTGDGFLYLLERQHRFPDLSSDTLNDRSKAEGFTKAISILQVFWLVVEVLARVASNLTVTELEINTLAHVVGALLTWSFWFYKPLRIGYPLVIDGPVVKAFRLANVLKNGACAHFMYQFLHQHYHHEKGVAQPMPGEVIQEPRVVIEPVEEARNRLDSDELPTSISNDNDTSSEVKKIGSQQSAPPINYVIKVHDPDSRLELTNVQAELARGLPAYADALYVQPTRNVSPAKPNGWSWSYSGYGYLGGGFAYRDLGKEVLHLNVPEMELFLELWNDPERNAVLGLDSRSSDPGKCCEKPWKLTLAPRNKGSFGGFGYFGSNNGTLPLREGAGLTDRAYNWHITPILFSPRNIIAISFATVFYGAIHAAAWNSHFPSVAEMWMWRVSSILATIFPLLPIGLFGLTLAGDMLSARDGARWTLHLLICLWVFIVVPAYGFGRVYLVVEAFISLRSQPASAYEMPRWSSLIPHL